MANSKFLIASILLSALVLQLVQAIPYQPPATAPAPAAVRNCTAYILPESGKIDCGLACTARCCKSSRINLCKRACNSCCKQCHCVPEGTYGGYDKCPCYYALTTHGGERKCP